MGFFSIIFWLFIGWLLYHLVKAVAAGHRMVSQYKQAMNNMRSAFGTNAPGNNRQPQSTRRKEKKIARDVGEYVDFEEVTESTTQKKADGSTTTYTQTEQQITDVTWEDL